MEQPIYPAMTDGGEMTSDMDLQSGPWLQQMYSAPLSDDPYIKLRRKLAADRKAALDRKRAADDATLPLVIQDHKDSVARAAAIEQRIELSMSSLQGAPPAFQQKGLNEGETMAAALSSLIAPNSMPQVIGALQAASQQRDGIEFENALRAYGLDRETAKMTIQQLLGRLDDETSLQRNLRGTEYNIRAQSAKSLEETIQHYDSLESELELLATKYGIDVKNRQAELAAEKERAIAAAKIKAEEERKAAEKERVRVLEQQSDNLRTEIISHTSTYGGLIPPALYDDLKRRRDRLVTEGAQGVPDLPPNNVKTKSQIEADENQKYREDEAKDRKERYKQEDRKWGMKGLAEGWLIGDVDSYRPNLQFKDKKDRGAKLGKMTAEIDKARNEVDELKDAVFTPNPDAEKGAEEQRDRGNKLQAALRREWQAVRTKRLLAGGKDIQFEDYMKERYPQLIGFWQGLRGALKDFKIQSDGKSSAPVKFMIDDVPVTIREKK